MFALALVAVLIPVRAQGAICVWKAGSTANFNAATTNWSCGAIPGASDDVYFCSGSGSCPSSQAGSTAGCTITAPITVNSLSLYSTYSGTVSAGSNSVDINGDYTHAGGTFSAPSSRLSVGGAFNKTSGTFTHNSGSVVLGAIGSKTFASNGASFYNLAINDHLVGYWKLDEASGTSAADGSGYGKSGTLTNGPTWATTGLAGLSFRDPAAVTFDGTNDYIDIGAPVTSTGAAFTACAWVNFTGLTGHQTFVSMDGTNISGFLLKKNPNTPPTFDFELFNSDSVSATPYRVYGTTTVTTGTWYHVCGVYTGSVQRIYVNGLQEGSDTAVGASFTATGHTIIGAGKWSGAHSDYVNGKIDDVRIYDWALSTSDIATLAAGHLPNSGTGVQNLTGNPSVANDLIIASGTLVAGSATLLSVGGNWWNYGGSFTPSSGTVAFNGASSGKYLQLAGQTFNNLTISGAGAWSFAEPGIDLTLSGTFAQSAGTFTSTSGLLKIKGAFNETGGTFTHNSGTVMLGATTSQSFSPNGATFSNLVVNDGLAGYWTFDENSGTAAGDVSGYGNSGTLTNGAAWTTTVPSLRFNNTSAISFDGTNDFVDVGAAVTPSNAALTACTWVRFNALTAHETMVSIDGTNISGFFLQKSPSHTFDIAIRASDTVGSALYQATGTTVAATGTWYDVCGVYTGSVLRIYVNGVQEGTDVAVGSSWLATGHTIFGAAAYGGRVDYLAGLLDDVRIYSRALSDPEIGSLYLGNQPGTSVATQTMSGSATVSGDLTVASGAVDLGTNTINLAGDWWNYGGRFWGSYSTGATLNLTGSGTTNYIRSAGQVLPTINITGSGKWTLADNLDVDPNGGITFTTGSLDISTRTLRVPDLNSGSGTLTASSGTVVLNSSAAESVNVGSYGVLRVEDPTESNLVGYWKLDEGQGPSSRDWTGGGHTATLTNAPLWTTTVPPTPEFSNAGAIKLASSDSSYLDMGTGVTATNAAFSACTWVNFTALSGTHGLVAINGANVPGFSLSRDSGGKFSAEMRASDSAAAALYQVLGTTTPTTGAWYHVCTVFTGSSLRLYVNGAQEGTPATVGSTWNASGHATAGGSFASGALSNFVSGYLDDVRVYSVALSPTQVKALANGRYPGTGGTATYTLGANMTVSSTFAIDSGNVTTSTFTLATASGDATKVAYVGAGTLTVGSSTATFNGGLTVRNEGTLAMQTAGGVAALGSGKTLTIDGALDASTAGASPTIQAVSGSYTFTVGSSATATPVLNINGLQVKNTGIDGMYINTVAGSSTTFTKFDNLAFSSGSASAGSTFLRIYGTSLILSSAGDTFTFAASKPDYAVKVAGNGTSDGDTRALFGNALCPSSLCTSSNKSDDDANGDGIGDNSGSNGAVVQFVRNASSDTAGVIEGFPTAAFDWNTFTYYATYVGYRSFSGSQDRLFVRASSGAASYFWDLPTAAGHLMGTPRWTQLSGTRYVYVATTGGYIYKLVDNGTSLALAPSPWDTAYCYGGSPCSANDSITSPLGMDGTNLYWVGTDSSSSRKFFILTHGKSLTSAALSIPAAVTAAPGEATISSIDYLFAGMQGFLYKIKISDQSSTSWTQPATTSTINGRVTPLGGLVYLADNRGHIYAVNASSLATDWSYQDTATHGGSCTDGGNCTIKNLYADYVGRVMYGDQDGHVYVITKNGSSATVMPGYPIQPAAGEVISTAPLYQAGIMLVGTDSGSLFVVNLRTTASGTPAILSSYQLGAAVSSISYNSNTNGNTGAYMVGTANGKLFFIDKVSDPDAYQ